MPENRISTESVSSTVAKTSEIVLRETDAVRLVFLTSIIENEDPLDGCFVAQLIGAPSTCGLLVSLGQRRDRRLSGFIPAYGSEFANESATCCQSRHVPISGI